MTLNLRTRLLTGVAIIAVVQVVAAAAVISITSDQLLDQVDDRLVAAADVVEDSDRDRIERISDVFQGIVTADGTLVTLNSIVERGSTAPNPVVTPAAIAAAGGEPFTAEAERSKDEYRVIAVNTSDGSWFVVAGLLDGYEWTINRLVRAIATATAVVGLVLAAVTWWVTRLGIRPVKHMTATAEAIAAGDLSERIENTHAGTEVGQLGEALNAMMGRIEHSFEDRVRAEERLRQFIADASHELRTPVATIRGYAELYEAGGLANAHDLDDAMRRTSQESERMSRLIADMLHLAKLDRDPSVATQPVDLDQIVRDAAADAAVRHPQRTISTDLAIDAVVAGDEDLLRQAVGNLVGNALVHTNDTADVSISLTARSNLAMVTVSDGGPGMSSDEVRRATERFYRADPSRSRHRGGSGLGLAIVQSVVEAHGGELDIVSTPTGGTTVTIAIPFRTTDSRQTHSELGAESEVRSSD